MAAEAVPPQLAESVKELLSLSESELEIELGRRVELTKEQLAAGKAPSTASPTPPTADAAALQGPLDFFRNAGRSFVRRLNRQFYGLICDTKDPDNAQVRAALAGGAQNLALVLSGALAVSCGILPGIAAVAGTLVAKRVADAGHKAICEAWKKEL